PKTTPHGKPNTSAGSARTTTPPTTTSPNRIAAKVASTPGLSQKVATLLPTGMTLDQASRGFKNQGQFIAALHVSRNLGISFPDLKTAMTGINPVTGTQSGVTRLSLGQAIQKLRPSANSTTAAELAERQAKADLDRSPTTRTAVPRTPSSK